LILVDSSVWVDYFWGKIARQTDKLDLLLGPEPLAAKNYRVLRRRGVTIRKTIDTIIATRYIESGYDLLHNDRDFDPFAAYLELSVIS
jgi:predicted nucleic acid-binding protein